MLPREQSQGRANMLGTLTATSEGHITLTGQDVRILKEYSMLGGTLIRTPGSKAFLLILTVSRFGQVRAHGLPRTAAWERKQCYYLEILPSQLKRIEAGKTAVLEQPDVALRKIFVQKEDTF